MQHDPLVTVLINNYNYGRFVAECIESALRQSHGDSEVIVVDDGSDDNSLAVLARYEARVKVIQLPHGGQGAALNAGVQAARGKLVALLDSDDYFHEHKVSAILDAHRAAPDAVMYCHPAQCVTADGRPIGSPIPRSLVDGHVDNVVRRSGGWYAWPPTSCLVLNRARTASVFPIPAAALPICADSYIANAAAFLGPVRFLRRPLAFYRLHGRNAWSRQTLSNIDRATRGVRTYEAVHAALDRFLARMGSKPVDLCRSFMYRRAVWEAGNCRSLEVPDLIVLALRYPAFYGLQRVRAALGVIRRWISTRLARTLR